MRDDQTSDTARIHGSRVAALDFHIHTSSGSPCSILEPADLVVRALDLGLTGIAITDHESAEGFEAVRRLAQGTPLIVFSGQEVWTEIGDLLVFGCARDLRPQMEFDRVVAAVEEEDGAIVLAHPFRHHPFGRNGENAEWERACRAADAIEVLNGLDHGGAHRLAEECRERFRLRGTGGSDAHRGSDVGKCLTVSDHPVRDERDLVSLLKHGPTKAVHRDTKAIEA